MVVFLYFSFFIPRKLLVYIQPGSYFSLMSWLNLYIFLGSTEALRDTKNVILGQVHNLYQNHEHDDVVK